MTNERPREEKVLVSLQEADALIRVEGRATFKISSALKQFGQAAMDRKCHRMVLDMEDCSGMDSTFMGVLAGLASRLRREGGEMVLIHLNSRTRGLVATLGLDHIVSAFETGQTPELYEAVAERVKKMSTLAPKAEGRQDAARTVLEAHEQLIQLDPANQPRFKDVLAFLREDLDGRPK